MEEAESRASQLTRSKTLLQSQLEELKKQLDEEVKVRVSENTRTDWEQTSDDRPRLCRQSKQAVGGSLSLARQECEVLREQLEEEQESKQEMQRLVSKLNGELTHWRTKHEADAIQHADELEETRCVVPPSASALRGFCNVRPNGNVGFIAGRSSQPGFRRPRKWWRPPRRNAPR